MNRLISLVLFSVSTAVCDHVKSFNPSESFILENISQEDTDVILSQIQLKNPPLIYITSENLEAFEAFYLNNLASSYPYIYTDSLVENLMILSRYRLDHVQIYKFDAENYVIETGSDNQAAILFWGHLPHLNFDQIETLKSYFLANNTYLITQMGGDFNLTNSYNQLGFEFCNQKEYGMTGTIDTDGNKSIKADYQVKSDDDRFSFKTEVSFKENDQGQKKGEVVVEIRSKH